uniref:Uncharacterized protein n=1 Tax=Romanomermis culicivorax TaxID=13658 RepID=A0A915JXX8_ROMCU
MSCSCVRRGVIGEHGVWQGELQLLLRGMTREQFIECGRLVVGQIPVGGSSRYLAIGVGFGVL